MKIFEPFKKIKKLPSWIYFFAALILKFSKTFLIRTEIVDIDNAFEQNDRGKPFITVTWHNRLLYFPAMFPKKYRKRTYALISPSRDGQYVVDLISRFGVRSIRGSTFKRGASALKKCEEVLKKGAVLSITPDGPRGPKYKMSKGPVILASRTGVSILPVAINASKYWQTKTWDNFQIAKPGAKVKLVLGKPIEIPGDLTDEELKKWQKIVEDKLIDASSI
ncbi:MAG: lysophospholipid acyltransferase family protein [Victivallales bacterium]|nr:lysophospholipid acyltransferase family protein [Victivallales bacterium]MCF7889362.1 lysophospholipid acyltransferase family protein [Victivallales bacterium]